MSVEVLYYMYIQVCNMVENNSHVTTDYTDVYLENFARKFQDDHTKKELKERIYLMLRENDELLQYLTPFNIYCFLILSVGFNSLRISKQNDKERVYCYNSI